jgi:hypothetical protein
MINETARNQFAAANGWRIGKSFTVDQLILNKKNSREIPRRRELDHPEFFRVDGYPIAMLGHCYRGTGEGYIDGVKEMVVRLGGKVVLHI